MKKLFIVSAIMLFAVGAMTSCKDSVENGCHCTMTASYQGKSESKDIDVDGPSLKEAGFTSCRAYATKVQEESIKMLEEMGIQGPTVKVSCVGK